VSEAIESGWPGFGTGGSLALDFANTLDWRLREPPVELLKSFADLLRWSVTAAVLPPRVARRLQGWEAAHSRPAARALAEAVAVREAIAQIFQAVARGDEVPPQSLARLDDAIRRACVVRSLLPEGRGVRWEWREAERGEMALDAARPCMAVALDAARLLTSPERDRVRQCGDAKCGWLFLDTSRNRSRRWCTMEGCGNRNKARRFQDRQRTG